MTKRLLYVEDIVHQGGSLKLYLQMRLGRDWEICLTNRYEEAVSLAIDPDLSWTACILDLDLRERREFRQATGLDYRDGVMIAKQFRPVHPDVPVLLVTASEERRSLEEAPEIARLFTAYIPKIDDEGQFPESHTDALADRILEAIKSYTEPKNVGN